MTGINSALGPITAACPGDGKGRGRRRQLSAWTCAPQVQAERYREETDGKELSEEVRGILIKKDGPRKRRGEAKQI